MYVCLGGFANSLMVINTKNRIETVKRADSEKKTPRTPNKRILEGLNIKCKKTEWNRLTCKLQNANTKI